MNAVCEFDDEDSGVFEGSDEEFTEAFELLFFFYALLRIL